MFSYRGGMHDTPSSRKVSCHTFKIFIVNIQVNISQTTPQRFSFHTFPMFRLSNSCCLLLIDLLYDKNYD